MSLLFILKLYLFLVISYQDNFQSFKFSMEQKVKSISSKIESIYLSKCQNQLIRNCTVKSIHSCEGTELRQCMPNLPLSTECPGTGFYSRASVVRTPNWITKLNMSQETKQFICSTAQPQFQSVLANINNQNHKSYAWVYFGSSEGSFRVNPGFKSCQSSPGICSDYDPRLRPWYSQNAYNRKNVVLIASTSSTMALNGGSRFNGMITSINALIRTFDHDDFLNIVAFSNNAQSILNLSHLIPVDGDLSKRDIFFNAVANLTPNKQSYIDFQKAFITALNIFNQSLNINQVRSDCSEYIILFFADGNPNFGQKDAQKLKVIIDQKIKAISPNFSLTVFTFNVNKEQVNIHTSVMSQLSCYYGGIHFNVPQIIYESQFITAAQEYFQFLSYGNQITSPTWSQIYLDAFGLGQMTAVVIPAYYIDGSNKLLLGVAGIDVLVSQFKIYEPDQKQIEFKLASDGACFVKKLKGCQLQSIRKIKCNQTNCNSNVSSQSNSSFICQNFITNITSIFKQALDKSNNRCCQYVIEQDHSIVITTTVIGFVVLTIIVAMIYYWKCKKDSKLSYDDLKKFQDFDMTRIRSEQQISPIHD